MRKQLVLTAFFAALVAPVTVQAAPPDEAWLAWVGCWRAEGDSSERSLCIVPDGDGVRMITLNAGKIEAESRIVANGRARAITQEGCSGTETATWSDTVTPRRTYHDCTQEFFRAVTEGEPGW